MAFIRLSAAVSASLLVAASASSSFVGYIVTSEQVELNGQSLAVYTLAARFDGSSDTVWRGFDLAAENHDWFLGFWHKDNHGDEATNGLLSQDFGTWNPSRTGGNLANRPYDSYLTIGGIARASNTTQSMGAWFDGDKHSPRAWDQAALPMSPSFNWYVDASSSVVLSDAIDQGRVGNSPGLPLTDVRLGQFVLSEGHEARTFSLSIVYSSGYSLSDDEQDHYSTASGTFTLGNPVPAPGALALAVLGAHAARRRRR